MIFEFKNATAVKGGDTLFSDVSFVAQSGDAVAVTGNTESRKALLLAMLGMRPLKSGWVSIDGEPVTATTGTYFRQFIAYQPDSLDFEGLTVQEVAKSQFALKVNADYAYSAKAVAAELMRLGVADDCMQKGFDEMEEAVAQRASLTLVGMFERQLLLLDNPTSRQDEAGCRLVADYIMQKRSEGVALIVATGDQTLLAVCNKRVNL
ncbi:ATP-binding cassette domain-containing protein [Leyella stercorea]|uniref:ATP-binding cassette domain-containing protein n=1 Tax=Leyella stercorea TaxID=363265 RepID=UPI002430B47D|nr:ATP-binding cassette domain-containing protein [Leyella stercorea]